MMMVKRRKKAEADRPGKRLFLCSFINLSVLECPVGRCWGGWKVEEVKMWYFPSEILLICLANTFESLVCVGGGAG